MMLKKVFTSIYVKSTKKAKKSLKQFMKIQNVIQILLYSIPNINNICRCKKNINEEKNGDDSKMKINFTDGKKHKWLARKLLKKAGNILDDNACIVYDPAERIGKLTYDYSGKTTEKVLLNEKFVDLHNQDYEQIVDYRALKDGAVFRTEKDERIVKTSSINELLDLVKRDTSYTFYSRTTDISAAIDELVDKRKNENTWDFLLPAVYGASLTISSVHAYAYAPQEFAPLLNGLCLTGLLTATIGLINGGLKGYIFQDNYLKKLEDIKNEMT